MPYCLRCLWTEPISLSWHPLTLSWFNWFTLPSICLLISIILLHRFTVGIKTPSFQSVEWFLAIMLPVLKATRNAEQMGPKFNSSCVCNCRILNTEELNDYFLRFSFERIPICYKKKKTALLIYKTNQKKKNEQINEQINRQTNHRLDLPCGWKLVYISLTLHGLKADEDTLIECNQMRKILRHNDPSVQSIFYRYCSFWISWVIKDYKTSSTTDMT